MRKYLWVFIFMPLSVFAQNKNFGKGQEYLNIMQYEQALIYFHKAEPEISDPVEQQNLFLQIALCYSSEHSPINSIKYYERAMELNPELTSDQQLDYVSMLIESGEYQKAKDIIQNMNEGLIMEEILLKKCNYAIDNPSINETIILLPISIPADYSCYGISSIGGKLFYILHKNNSGSNGSDYLFVKEENHNDFFEKLTDIELPLNFSCPNYDSANQILYFSGNVTHLKKYLDKKRENQKIGAGGVNNLYIWSYNAFANTDNFSTLPFNNIDYSCTHPFITDNGNTMYFSSNMLGGFGGFDIYKVTKNGDEWGIPENLGRQINTFLNEGYPFFIDGFLYFASDGHPGYGGLDIFRVDLQTMEIENPGKPINSSFDDFSFIKTSDNDGYFLSNRLGTSGKDIIFKYVKK